MRTEWAHHSTLFIGEENHEPLLVVKVFRRKSDRKQFNEKITCTIPDIIDWTRRAVDTIDGFASYLLTKYIFPSFDLDAIVLIPQYDEHGFPKMTRDHRFEIEEISIRELLQRRGVLPRPQQ